jgi:hypothetical protein
LSGDDFFVVVGWNNYVSRTSVWLKRFGERHDDHSFGLQSPRCVGDSLRVIAAGVGDDAAGAFFVSQRGDFVVRATQFECADGLEVFGLQIERAALVFQRDEGRADGDSVEAGAGGEDVGEGDDFVLPAVRYLSSDPSSNGRDP